MLKASGFISSENFPFYGPLQRFIINKVIILPIAFFVERLIAVIIILVLGGLYLAYEGAEKYEYFFRTNMQNTKFRWNR
jgi:predicted DNA repair protein MutK